ncbi:sideroflexin-5a [Clarias gariepinus]|uniref:sideroflexin-5a n=1 Tax=Clarias gariepinus TaxID=13013 RepID=UPI00234CB8B1|nr:sideroflexin-5a [Clarias gariepinus]
MSQHPQFRLSESRFDKGSFYSRLRHFLDVIDPRALFVFEKIKQAIFHPDTREKIPIPLCMSAQENWQNGRQRMWTERLGKSTGKSKFFKGYLGVVTSAVMIESQLAALLGGGLMPWGTTAITTVTATTNGPMPVGSSKLVLALALSCTDVISYGVAMMNCFMKRQVKADDLVFSSRLCVDEVVIKQPLPSLNQDCYGGLLPCTLSHKPPRRTAAHSEGWGRCRNRVISHHTEEVLALLQTHPRLALPMHGLVCLCTFSLALPLAISLFPRIARLHVSQLEPKISAGTKCKFLTYNKDMMMEKDFCFLQ